MSYSTLYAVFRTKAIDLREYRNSWGTGPLVWGYLCEKYLGRPRHSWSDDKKLWSLAENTAVPVALRMCHAVTFDYALIPRGALLPVANLLDAGGEILQADAPDYVNHFAAIANDLRELKLDPRALGVAINCTSVSDIWEGFGKKDRKPFDCYAYVIGATP